MLDTIFLNFLIFYINQNINTITRYFISAEKHIRTLSPIISFPAVRCSIAFSEKPTILRPSQQKAQAHRAVFGQLW